MIVWYIFLFIILEITIFVRGNAKFVWGWELHPLEWWLYLGWVSSLVGLTSWWGLVEEMGMWKATIFAMALSFTISFLLKAYFFQMPSTRNMLALVLCWTAVLISENPQPKKEVEIEENPEETTSSD